MWSELAQTAQVGKLRVGKLAVLDGLYECFPVFLKKFDKVVEEWAERDAYKRKGWIRDCK